METQRQRTKLVSNPQELEISAKIGTSFDTEVASNTVARKMSKEQRLEEIIVSKLEEYSIGNFFLQEPIILIQDVTAEEFNELDDETFYHYKIDWKSHQDTNSFGDIWLVEMPTVEHGRIAGFIEGEMYSTLRGNRDISSDRDAVITLTNSAADKQPDVSFRKRGASGPFFVAEVALSQPGSNLDEKMELYSEGLPTLECALAIKVFRSTRQLKIIKFSRDDGRFVETHCQDGVVQFRNVPSLENVIIDFNLLINDVQGFENYIIQ